MTITESDNGGRGIESPAVSLTEFLLARIWDDETVARAAEGVVIEGAFAAVSAAHMIRHNPARVLAECDAKRRIVRWCMDEGVGNRPIQTQPLRYLALPYADHPDYLEKWKP